MFYEALENARRQKQRIERRLAELRRIQREIGAQLDEAMGVLEEFETALAIQGLSRKPICVRAALCGASISVDPYDHRQVAAIRDYWSEEIRCLRVEDGAVARRIRSTVGRLATAEEWIARKEESWGHLDPKEIKRQMRSIFLAAEELSVFLLGRCVSIEFDTRDEAPLGYVPVRKVRKVGRRIFLSGEILGAQPPHVTELYQALIVHELGHLLLHLHDAGRDYHRFRKLLAQKMTTAPGFFELFNTLLDEQLERVLRHTRPEWQRWFNRLDFYTRRIPLTNFKRFLSADGTCDPQSVLEDFAQRGWIKIYEDPQQPFAVIQSAEVFSQPLGFSRSYAFFTTLRYQLPAASIRAPWLRECLDCIPSNFKALDVFQIHGLTVQLYKILMEERAEDLFPITIDRGKRGTVEVEVPGSWLVQSKTRRGRVIEVASRADPRKKTPSRLSGGSVLSPQNASAGGAPQPNPEGEPLPPPPPPEPPEPPAASTSRRQMRRGRSRGGRPAPTELPGWYLQFLASQEPPSGVGDGVPELLSAREALEAKMRSGRISAREKARLRRAISAGNAKPPVPAKAARRRSRRQDLRASRRPSPPPSKPSPPSSAARPPTRQPRAASAAARARRAAPPAAWSPKKSLTHFNRSLEQVAKAVREEIRRERSGLEQSSSITEDGGLPSDYKCTAPRRQFPPPESIVALPANPKRTCVVSRRVTRFRRVLRPFLTVIDQQRRLEERLVRGRRLLSSGLQKHVAYGETRFFKDQRFDAYEEHGQVFLAVLVDASASSQTDGRLNRAVELATLLADCLSDCPDVASTFLGYSQHVFLCGSHDSHSLTSLSPRGKTNEAAALRFLSDRFLQTPRKRKGVIVLSDGLPTSCSVEAVQAEVALLERDFAARCLYGALSAEPHPAYRQTVDLSRGLDLSLVRAFGAAIARLLC